MLPLAEDLTNEAVQEVTAETGELKVENVPVAAPPSETFEGQRFAKRDDKVKNDDPARSEDGVKGGEDSMASSAERMTILRMIEQGKISAEEGARLLSALGSRQEPENNTRRPAFDTSRQVQVRVSDLGTNRQKVNVTLPVGLVQLAWNWLPSSTKAQFDQVQIAINSGAIGRLVEVVDQDSGVRVEISVL